ncbi:hypothetical protein [Holdemania filiformis]
MFSIHVQSYRASGMWIEMRECGARQAGDMMSYRASGMWIEIG